MKKFIILLTTIIIACSSFFITSNVSADTYLQQYYFPFDYTLTQINPDGQAVNIPTVKYFTTEPQYNELYIEIGDTIQGDTIVWQSDYTIPNKNIIFKRNYRQGALQNYKLELNNITLDKMAIDNYNIDIDLITNNYFFDYTIKYIDSIEYDIVRHTTNITYQYYSAYSPSQLPIFSTFINYLESENFVTKFKYRTNLVGWQTVEMNSNYIFIENLSMEMDNFSSHELVFTSNIPRGTTYDNLSIYYMANTIFDELVQDDSGAIYHDAYTYGYGFGFDLGYESGYSHGEEFGYEAAMEDLTNSQEGSQNVIKGLFNTVWAVINTPILGFISIGTILLFIIIFGVVGLIFKLIK